MPSPQSFNRILAAAVSDIASSGFDSEQRLAYWVGRLRRAANEVLVDPAQMNDALRRGLVMIYRRLVERGGIMRYHPGINRFTLNQVAPRLRAELERRINASAQLIRLNRDAAIEETLRRFAGWASSVPAGGTDRPIRTEVSADVRKPLSQLSYREQRVLIDQGHKLTAALSEVLARDNAAIAVIWHSHWRQAGYDYREDHKERDKLVYLLRDSWANDKGYVKPGSPGYYDDISHVGEEVNCRCYAEWVYSLRALPANMLTAKGKAALEAARAAVGRRA